MSWWQQVYQYGRQLLVLTEKVEKHEAEIKEMRRELKELTDALRHLAYEVKLDRETEAKDRQILLLDVRGELLRFERSLPPPSKPPEE